jgi:mRNA-degrading endonuclease RelE of RelBE toxin-antitoxin system
MIYKVEVTENFKKEAKKLIRKYPSLKQEILQLGEQLAVNPTLGTPLGNEIYKIRLSIKSKGKGKSGGARIITKVILVKKTVYLFSIYSKGDKETISENEIKLFLKEINPFK